MTLCVTSLKKNCPLTKELTYSTKANDIVHKNQNFRDYLQIAFAKTLEFHLEIF